tara:strand:+ start:328 stop:495 length:168 start_codon:yes stop_codon:yes gene_type:complete
MNNTITQDKVEMLNEFAKMIETKNNIREIINAYEHSKMERITKEEFLTAYATSVI